MVWSFLCVKIYLKSKVQLPEFPIVEVAERYTKDEAFEQDFHLACQPE